MSSLLNTKKIKLRSNIRKALKDLSQIQIKEQSASICAKVTTSEAYMCSRGLSVYLPMAKEVQTYDIISCAFKDDKKVFVPKVLGDESKDMIMIQLKSLDELESFHKNKWGIPEPPVVEEDAAGVSEIDLVLVPGVAFDSRRSRLGHGKGYYDCFLSRIDGMRDRNGAKVTRVGLALEEQILDDGEIPMEEHDSLMDMVFSSSNCFKQDVIL